MTNPWKQFEKMVAGEPLTIVTVAAHNADGTSTVTTIGGGQMIVRGQSVALSSKAYVRDGEVKGGAPSLSYYELEV